MDLLIKGILEYSTIGRSKIVSRFWLLIEEIQRTILFKNIQTVSWNGVLQNLILFPYKEKGLIELGATESENDFQFY
jgi:predicted transglutaminase-like protease